MDIIAIDLSAPSPTSTPSPSGPASPTQPHIILIAFPFGTHVLLLHALTCSLASEAPDTIFSFVSTPEALNSLPEPLENLALISYGDAIPELESSVGVLDRIDNFLAAAQENITAAVRSAVELADGVPVSCVMSDAFMWMSESTAAELGVPWIVLFTAFTPSILTYLHTDDLRTRFGIEEEVTSDHWDELLDFIPGLEAYRVRDLPEGIICGGINTSYSFHLRKMGQLLPRATAVILPTLAVFVQDLVAYSELNMPLMIGPLNLISRGFPSSDEDDDCIQWLNSKQALSVAYVAFGAVTSLSPAELVELAYGLEDSGVSFLWIIKNELRLGLPDGFEERTLSRGKLADWAPESSVLKHPAVGVFVSACGWNSTLESITAGVVMLCKPIFADEMMVARAMVDMLGVGRYLDGFITREGFVTAMDEIMKGIEGKKMREKVKKVKEDTVKAMLPGGILSESFDILVELVSER